MVVKLTQSTPILTDRRDTTPFCSSRICLWHHNMLLLPGDVDELQLELGWAALLCAYHRNKPTTFTPHLIGGCAATFD